MSFTYFGVFLAGLLTFISPCVLPLVPVFTANFLIADGKGRMARLKATLWFVLGFTAIFVLMGLSLPGLTAALGSAKPFLLAAGGVLLALFGMKMMGWISTRGAFSWMERSLHLPSVTQRIPKGLHGLLFGALFGLSWTPCVGPILGGVLTYVASQNRSAIQAALLLGSFALGIGLPLIAFSLASEYLTPWLNGLKKHLPKIEYAMGVGLVIFGVYIFNQARLQIRPEMEASGAQAAWMVKDDSGRTIDLATKSPDVSRMVFFYSTHCPICHAMETYLPDFEKSCASSHFQFIRVNVDDPENDAVARRFNVQAVPTISVLSENGQELLHLIGYQTESRLKEAAKGFSQVACNDNTGVVPPETWIPAEGKTCSPEKGCS